MRGSGTFPRFNKEVWDHNFKLVEGASGVEVLTATVLTCSPCQRSKRSRRRRAARRANSLSRGPCRSTAT